MEDQIDSIDRVIKKTVEVLKSSKYQIYEIYENAISERESLQKELARVKQELDHTIDNVDKLESHYKLARIRLQEVSRNFEQFREEDILRSYELATSLQLDLTVTREKEMNLKIRRDELSARIRAAERTVERAKALGSQMSVVLDYISGDLTQVTRILESAKNRQLIGLKIVLAQEDERKRIARDIHDGVAQTIANVVLRAEIAEKLLARESASVVQEELDGLKSQARSGLEEIRKIIFNLRPMALDDLGLVPILRKLSHDFENKERIHTEFSVTGKEARLPSAMELAIYRLVQEAFHNVTKHAQATHVALDLVFQAQMVKITIKDNGRGFPMDQLQKLMTNGEHYGLLGMKERVELLEGRFEIDSAPGAGTRITMLIPIKSDS